MSRCHAPLTAWQQSLAAEPRYLHLARAIARRYGRSFPRLADEFRSEALLALCQAARTFEPHRKIAFSTHAVTRINGAMLDVCRGLAPRGYRRRDPAGAPRVGSLSRYMRPRGNDEPVTPLADVIPAGELPVGWEAEYQDDVAGFSRHLPARHGEVLRTLYGRADTATMQATGAALGFSEGRVSQVHSQAVAMLGDAARPSEGRRRTGS